jgi:hypothetical protein
MTASPAPSKKRIAIKIQSAPLTVAGVEAVTAVNIPHQNTPAASTRRGPKRSAKYPPTVWNKAYPIKKALNTQPNWMFENPYAFAIEPPATAMFTRSR